MLFIGSWFIFLLLFYRIFYYRGGQLRKRGGAIELKPGEEQKMYRIKNELTELEREERLLDTHLRWMKQVIFGFSQSLMFLEYSQRL